MRARRSRRLSSNSSFLRVGLGLTIGPDDERIPARPPLLDGARVTGVLVGHAHYDHLMDVPSVLAASPRTDVRERHP
jgi:mRNA degradation ribonuclease J1/J2